MIFLANKTHEVMMSNLRRIHLTTHKLYKNSFTLSYHSTSDSMKQEYMEYNMEVMKDVLKRYGISDNYKIKEVYTTVENGGKYFKILVVVK